MIKGQDFALAAIGIFYIVIGVRGYDLGSLAHWKYFICIALGVLFILGALYRSSDKKGLPTKVDKTRQTNHKIRSFKMSAQRIYDVFVFALIITIQLYFFIFVHKSSDYAPNIALLVCCAPVIVIQFIKMWRHITGYGKRRRN